MKMNKLLISLIALLISHISMADIVTLTSKNTVRFNAEVTGESVGKAIYECRNLDTSSFTKRFVKPEPIYLFMNTPGGSIQSGLELLEGLHGLNRPVNTVTLFAASMGFQMVQGLGERLILQNGVLMSHRATGMMGGSFGGTRPSQMDSRYNLWLQRMEEFDQQTVKRTKGKQTLESYQKAYANELWLTGSQAVEQGYADKVVNVRCDSSLNGVTTYHFQFLGLDIAYDLDNCPINTSPMNVRVSSPNTDQDSLTPERIEEVKNKFLDLYNSRSKIVVNPYW